MLLQVDMYSSLSLFSRFLLPPASRTRARTSDREDYMTEGGRRGQVGCIAPSFVYSQRKGGPCNGQRCVETGGREPWRTLHKWGCKLASPCSLLFADLCARITPQHGSTVIRRGCRLRTPLLSPFLRQTCRKSR